VADGAVLLADSPHCTPIAFRNPDDAKAWAASAAANAPPPVVGDGSGKQASSTAQASGRADARKGQVIKENDPLVVVVFDGFGDGAKELGYIGACPVETASKRSYPGVADGMAPVGFRLVRPRGRA
jgi:hypothetical protein